MESQVFAFAIVGAESEWFWMMCQVFIVLFTFAFVLRQLKLQNDSHLVNSFDILNKRWNSETMLKARRMVCEQYEKDHDGVSGSMEYVCLFFEELGTFTASKVLNIDLVWEIYSFEIEHYWVIANDDIIDFRQNQNDNSFYYHFERLYCRILELSAAKKVPSSKRTRKEVKQFIEEELKKINFFVGGN